jgi:hypothetical protein
MILGPAVVTVVDAGKVKLLNQGKVSPAAVGSLFAATCDLFVSAIVPTGNTQFGDLTLPAWTAYSAQAITWNNAAQQVVDLAQMDGDSVTFALPANSVGQTIYGWAVSDSTPILIAVGILLTPVNIIAIGDAVAVPYVPWQT